ncbi:hypothetical protein [Pseudonocardia spirodelae]|uniref:Uncharacterized protein n=1 Tax=Pseudonocardia spirodelae TaxID=3133431 RepID=A0ABU8TBW0_9PSEU
MTDPFGFPPVPPARPAPVSDDVVAAWAAWAPAPDAGTTTPAADPGGAAAPSPDAAGTSAPSPGAAGTTAPSPGTGGTTAPSPDAGGATAPVPAGDTGPTVGPAAAGALPATAVDAPVPAEAAPAPATGTDPAVPDPAAASALAGAFAADLLSWDEDDPARRGLALSAHLAGPADGLLGWTGSGRQRADLVLPGRVRVDGVRAVVEVRVRVVPYRRVDARGAAAPEPESDDPLGGPAAAPAPAARGWRGLAARWVRLEVGVVLDGDGLVVDAGPAAGPQRPPSPADLARGPR